MRIRTVEEKDTEQMYKLLKQLGYPPENKNLIRNRIKRSKSSKNMIIFIAEENNTVAGFLSAGITPLFHTDKNLGRVTALCVLDNYRRKGIGSKLMEKTDKYFRKNNCESIEVTSGNRPERIPAHLFYIQSGYYEDKKSKLFRKLL